MRNIKYLFAVAVEHKARVYHLYFIRAFLKAKVKDRIFVKLDCRCSEHFPEHSSYFGRALILMKSMYGRTYTGKLFADESTKWLIEAGSVQSQ